MIDWRSPDEWRRLWRYYQAGIVNTLFAFGLYALFVRLGMNIYVAQICSHVLGVTFNYFTYSRYAFADHDVSKARFVLTYCGNYVLGVAGLWCATQLIRNPYLAGLVSTVFVSAINYVLLKRLVFVARPS